MSTNDVPGADPRNGDELAMGCWAEHADGSMILVESTEANRAIYSLFDMDKKPPIEYRDAMPIDSFKLTFSWDSSGKKKLNEKWVWHDKTPFPWDRIIKAGGKDGPKSAAAEDTLNAAQRIMESRRRHNVVERYDDPVDFVEEYREGKTAAQRVAAGLKLKGQEISSDQFEHMADKIFNRIDKLWDRISGTISKLPQDKKKTSRASRGR